MLDPSFSACRAGEIELGFEPTSVNRGSEGSVLNRQSTELGRIRACQRKQGGERPLARSRGPRPNSGGTSPNGGTRGAPGKGGGRAGGEPGGVRRKSGGFVVNTA